MTKVGTPSSKAIISGYVAQALNIGYGVLILPFMLMYLSEEEVAYWLILLSFIGLVLVFDFGFSPTITRAVSYAMTGADEIKSRGFDNLIGDKRAVNWALLHNIIFSTKKIYLFITVMVILLFGISGTVYIKIFLERTPVEYGFYVWLIFFTGFVFNIYFLYYTPLLTGVGKLYEANLVNVIIRSIWLLFSIVGLLLFKNILVLPVAYFLGIFFGRLYSQHAYAKFLEQAPKQSFTRKSYFKVLFPNSWRMGVVMLGSFMISKATIFIAGLYLPAKDVASYVITLQVLAVTVAFSQVYFTSHIPVLSSLRLRALDKVLLRSTFLKILSISLFIYVAISLFVIIFGNDILVFIKSSAFLLSGIALILVFLFGLLEMNHTLAASFITTGNNVPFVLPALLSGFAIVILSLVVFGLGYQSVIWLILIQGGVQLLYNNWKWPLVVYKDFK